MIDRTKLFHTDSVLCGLSALGYQTNAPVVLRTEALEYSHDVQEPEDCHTVKKNCARVFGSTKLTLAEKAICANVSAVREWDSNGTVFGFRKGNPAH